MQHAVAILALAAGTAFAMPQGVTQQISPKSGPPAGCDASHSGTFEITVVDASGKTKRSIESRQLSGTLTLSLSNGILTDQAKRTGYIANNYQFQFDAPPQTGAIYTAGFSYCGNNSLALGGSSVFYQCKSGAIYNLYDRKWAPQCEPVYLVGFTSGTSAPPATQAADGQPGVTTAIAQLPDGQPRVTQITDGQPQGNAPVPVTQIADGQPQGPGPAVTQISDGQPQGGKPVTQISDGQPQGPKATTAAAVTQISDGQPQGPKATTAAPPAVTQISDGQPQGNKPVTQISDGQPQAPAGTGSPVTPSNGTVTSPPIQQYSGNSAAKLGSEAVAAAIGFAGIIALL